MKTFFLIALSVIICLSSISMSAQDVVRDSFTGKCYGYLIVNTKIKLRVAFEMSRLESGEYDAVMHSVDQKIYNNTVDKVTISEDSIYMHVRMMGAIYSGKVCNDALITGYLNQPKGKGKQLNLIKCDSFPFPIAKRPQEPRKPYGYISEDVKFFNKKAGISLSGTLTKPLQGKKLPAVVLISGPGPSDRNQTIFGHKTFLVIADYLTRNGFAVLRYDDRGAGASVNDSISKVEINKNLASFDSLVSKLSKSDIEKLGPSVTFKYSDYSKLMLPFMKYDLFHNLSEILNKVNKQLLPGRIKMLPQSYTQEEITHFRVV